MLSKAPLMKSALAWACFLLAASGVFCIQEGLEVERTFIDSSDHFRAVVETTGRLM